MTNTGRDLYGLMPAVYRARDDGSLAGYLDACGELLDTLRATLDQLLADAFPEGEGSRAPQTWVLPYHARLLDVTPVSPLPEDRRVEVTEAVAWRQRKGTLGGAEEVTKAIAGTDAELHEGLRRVAVTPWAGLRLPPWQGTAAGGAHGIAGHPALPAITPDLRRTSRAVPAATTDPDARTGRFGGNELLMWRQAYPHGAPAHLGAFDDVSRRTPDLRTPGRGTGYHHPRRLLVFLAPPPGFFGADAATQPVELPAVTVGDGQPYQLTDTTVTGTLEIRSAGPVVLRRVAARKLTVAAPALRATDCLIDEIEAPGSTAWLEYCTVMTRCAALTIQASDCLFAGTLETRSTQQVRYSRVPGSPPNPTCTNVRPAFVPRADGHPAGYGERSYGVLDQSAPQAVLAGAEDGGELGAYHHLAYAARLDAVRAILADVLPAGVSPMVIVDPWLAVPPQEGAPS